MKITRRQIRRIILEYENGMLSKNHIDGHPWSGTLEDLASVQSKTWGHGNLVDPKAWDDSVNMARHWTQGTAKSAKAKKLNERFSRGPSEDKLRRSVVAFADDYMLQMGMNPSDPGDIRRTRRTIDDIIGTVLGD